MVCLILAITYKYDSVEKEDHENKVKHKSMKKALIIGAGRVGSELANQLRMYDFETKFWSGRKGEGKKETPMKFVGESDVFCIAIPTIPGGVEALQWIRTAVFQKIPTVTAEKASLSYHFGELAENLSQIGLTATVGGGSGILSLIQNNSGIESVFGVVNGTINFYSDRIASGIPVETVLRIIKTEGLCEPGVTDEMELVAAELVDVKYKLAIMANLISRNIPINPDHIKRHFISGKRLLGLLRSNSWRFVVHIYREPSEMEVPVVCLSGQVDDYFIRAGFIKTNELSCFGGEVRGANNALCVEFTDGTMITKIGPGAGPSVTARVMVDDVLRLLK